MIGLFLGGDGDQTRFLCLSYNFSLLLWNPWWKGHWRPCLSSPPQKTAQTRAPDSDGLDAYEHQYLGHGLCFRLHLLKIKNPFLHRVVKRMINHQQLESLNIIYVAWESTTTKTKTTRNKRARESRRFRSPRSHQLLHRHYKSQYLASVIGALDGNLPIKSSFHLHQLRTIC